MEFRHIEYFVRACGYRSLSEAAKSLFITQQALSRSVRLLERELGCALFERTARGITPTKAGQYLFGKFRPIVSGFHDAAAQAAASIGGIRMKRRLQFSSAPGVIRNLSPGLLLSFRERHPELEMDVLEMSDAQSEMYIRADKSRFGLMAGPEWLHARKHDYIIIKTEPTYLLVHRANPIADLPIVSLAALKNERVLALNRNSYFQEVLNSVVAPYHFSIEPYFESGDVMELIELANKGAGVLLCIRQVYEESSLREAALVPLAERTFDYCVAFVFQEYEALEITTKEFIWHTLESEYTRKGLRGDARDGALLSGNDKNAS
ncbi:MAG: LysR family transcriptional regulator [Oscillospiraceae bacterium]|jgi:DNA-binding transcriptional LysR family regulator|nr:LysR family transcriptional regulator [Oscillospiraceae bacterium]